MTKQQYREIRQSVRGNGLSYTIRHTSDYLLVSPFVVMATAADDELSFRARYFAPRCFTAAILKQHIKLFPLHWHQR